MSLRETIQQSFNDFFNYLTGESPSLNSFLRSCTSINDTITSRIAHNLNSLEEETLVVAHNFATDVKTLASDILDLHSSNEALFQQSNSDIMRILNEQMGTLTVDDKVSSFPDKGRHPAYMKPSLEWLLSNLHNPYPSKESKKKISRETKCSVKDIDAWFIDIRKRIGWNRLRKVHFDNKQEKIVAAATLIFRPKQLSFADDLNTSLISEMDSNDTYRPEFVAMAYTARSLYAERFPDLVTSTSFDPIATYASPPAVWKEDKEKSGSQFQTPTSWDSDSYVPPYPTPEPSPPAYEDKATPSTPSEASQTSQINTRKRRLSISDEEVLDSRPSNDSPSNHPKRRRCDAKQANCSPMGDLPSPSSTDYLPENITQSFTENFSSPTSAPNATLKRKRRLSDSEGQLPPKRPHNALCVPRLHAVSDPFPTPKSSIECVLDGLLYDSIVSGDQLSDSIPLPVNAETRSPLPVDPDLHYFSISSYSPDTYFLGNTLFPELESVVSDGPTFLHGESSSIQEPFSFPVSPQDHGNSLDDRTIPIQSDLVSTPGLLDLPETSDNFSIFLESEIHSSTPESRPDSLSLLNDIYDPLDGFGLTPISSIKVPVLGDFNQITPPCNSNCEAQAAKRARAKALREELAQLVAEGL